MHVNPETACRIITVTLNPAIDETIRLDTLLPGAVNRARSHHRQAGGKGVNLSRMLAQFGIHSTATGFLGSDNPELFEAMFHDHGIDDRFIRIPGETRSGIKLVDARNQQVTDINLPGPSVPADAVEALCAQLRGWLEPGSWCVISGSLPPGVATDGFVRLLDCARTCGANIGVDTSGPALQAAIAFGADLIKPNRHELAEVAGVDARDTVALLAAAGDLHARGISHVVLSLGEEGSHVFSVDGHCHAPPPPAKVLSTVGAGDAMLAGYLAGLTRGAPVLERMALATAFAWCALEDIGRNLPDPQEIARRAENIAGTTVFC